MQIEGITVSVFAFAHGFLGRVAIPRRSPTPESARLVDELMQHAKGTALWSGERVLARAPLNAPCSFAATGGGNYLVPKDDRSTAFMFGCPVHGCNTRRSNVSGRRGPSEMNRHVRTFHPTHKHLDIVYRACLLEDQPTNPRAYVLTHRERYEGAGLPIEPIHTLEAGFTGLPAAKRQCARVQAPETAAVLASTAVGEARPGAEAGKATAQTATGEARPAAEADMLGAREDANIRWALDRGHGVEVHAITIKYTPGST